MQNLINKSPMSLLASQPPEALRSFLATLTPQQKQQLSYMWRGWRARSEQLAPEGKWRAWLILAGRGFGKTRSGAEWVREQVESGRCRRIALVAETAADARKVMKGTRTAFRAEGEQFSERSDAGNSIVQEVFAFVKRNLSGA